MASASRAARLITQFEWLNQYRIFGRPFLGSALSSRNPQRYESDAAAPEPDYAFEMACSNIRYGPGVSREVGMDFKSMKANNVCVVTDKNVAQLPPTLGIFESLEQNGISYSVFDRTRVEPTDESFQEVIDFAKEQQFDCFLAVGGGSVIDTCKVANLYMCYPDAQLLDFVNAPIGKALPVLKPLKPLIAIATTAGTGSETTGVAIFDYLPRNAKTGIANRALRPTLGILDPSFLKYTPNRVTCYPGFDVLCHAVESFTAIPFNQRTPRPTSPIYRPAYQGSNPISDVWSRKALQVCRDHLYNAVKDEGNIEARSEMLLASAFAGIGFGNAGVHLCHGMSYPISGLVKSFVSPDYNPDHPLIPHGLSVIITAPAVFRFTASACPERHLEVAQILGADISTVKKEDAGNCLADILTQYMMDLDVPDGLSALGYTTDDIPALVEGTLPQERVTKIAPRTQTVDDLSQMLESSMKNY